VEAAKAKRKAEKAKFEAEKARIEAEKEVKKHVVERGDTLTAIALKYYGNAGEFMKIYEANKDVIGDNPDLILVGMELVIPEL
jgi:nucleoid-associated protein YgaU